MKKFLDKVLHNKKTNLLLTAIFIFCSILFMFPVGAISPSTTIENTADYLSEVTEKHTVNGTYTALMIEPNDTTDKKINNPYNEFHYLYGIFRERIATYIGSVNAEKTHSIHITEIEEDINFSFLNVDSGFGVKEYYKDEDGNQVYKTEYYPLELMFYSNHPYIPGSFSFLYLSQSKADILLDKQGLEHTRENYQSLLNSLITLEIDGSEYKFAIDNIYYERNYFYNAIDEVMGEFLLAGAKYPAGLKRQGLFFLRNYSYQNKFYIEYATSLYSEKDFTYNILSRNFKDGFEIDNSSIILFPNTPAAISVILLIVLISFLVVAALLIVFGSTKLDIWTHLIVAEGLLIPYLIFWIIYLFTKNVFLFSLFSTTAVTWSILVFAIFYIVVAFIKSSKNKKQKKENKEEGEWQSLSLD